ncbi:MAG: SPOR domain-containing protein [Pseudomonadota bacterium]|nr:SPOR domain-containing protein [Gammaproteobacteria bacterium]MDQ3581438.1 SPOR domain-containing protein [Pseudomonadota bacterium]
MKWWCVGLLVLNVVYFGFEYNHHLSEAVLAERSPDVAFPAGTATLTLVRERPEPPPLRAALGASLSPSSQPDTAPAAPPPAATGNGHTEPAPPTQAAEPKGPPPETPAPQAQEPNAPESESNAQASKALESNASESSNVASPEAPPPACASIGAFASAEEADKARQRIEGPGTQIRRRTEQEVFAKSYWVYLDNQGSAELARTRLAELAAKGVEDFLLDRTGDPKNAISLGLYNNPNSMKARVSALERQGFRPAVQERDRTREVYWLDVAARQEVLDRTKAALSNGPQVVSVGCDTIALGGTPP